MIAAIENAILARAKAASDAHVLGYAYQTLEAYPEDWEARLVSEPLNDPAIFVTFAGFDATDQLRSGARVTANFGIAVVAKSLRNKTAARQGDDLNPAQPGSLQLMEDTIGLVQGQSFGLEISGFELVGAQVPTLSDEAVKRGLSIMAMQWRTSFVFEIAQPLPGDGRDLGNFVTFNTQWDAPPFGTDAAPSIDLETQLSLPIPETP